jgi:spore coat polysaccharide biosynthesis protein SpsF
VPGKVLQDIEGRPMLARVVDRARQVPGVSCVLVATTTEARDSAIVAMAPQLGVEVVTGSEVDVLDRYYQAASQFDAEVVVRVTADCPMLDPAVSGRVVARILEGDVDYVTNCQPPTFPDGLDTEAVRFGALLRAWRESALMSEREHVTPFIWKRPELFRTARVLSVPDLSAHRWTVDDQRDLAFVREVYGRLLPLHGPCFGMAEVLALLEREPGLRAINAGIARNEGYVTSLAKEEGTRSG